MPDRRTLAAGAPDMRQFLQPWSALWWSFSTRQKLGLVIATVLVAGAGWSFRRWSAERDLKPLYTEMSNEEAAAVVSKLREIGVEYRLDNTGTTVWVPSARLAETRLQLDAARLPRNQHPGKASVIAGKEFTGEELEWRQGVEREITHKILHTLDPYLGPNRTRASVSAEVELNAGEQTEEVLDPKTVLVTSQRTEEHSQPEAADGLAVPASGGAYLRRKQEDSTYQASKTVRRMKLEKGAVKRLSVAVVVDHKTVVDASGKRRTVPRTPQEMKTIRDLVIAAAGIVEKRGDLLILENLRFEAPPGIDIPEGGPGAPAAGPERVFSKEWLRGYRSSGIGAFVVLVGWWAFWLRSRQKRKRPVAGLGALPGAPTPADLQAAQAEADEAALLEPNMPHLAGNRAVLLKRALAQNARKDPAATLHLLRRWIHEDE